MGRGELMFYSPKGKLGVNTLHCKERNQTLFFVNNPAVIEKLDKLPNLYKCFKSQTFTKDGHNAYYQSKAYVYEGVL